MMTTRKRRGGAYWARSGRSRLVLYGLIALVALWLVGPFVWLFVTSVSYQKHLMARPLSFIPPEVTLDNYRMIMGLMRFHAEGQAAKILPSMWNTLGVAGGVTGVHLGVGTPPGYAYARFRFPLKTVSLFALLFTRMLPTIVLIPAFFVIFRALGLQNTLSGLVVAYCSFTLPFTVWIMKAYFETVPGDLDKSALVDGCNRLQAYYKVGLPVSGPGLVAWGAFTFMLCWNEFVVAQVLNTKPGTTTLPPVIAGMNGQINIDYSVIAASGFLAAVPAVLLVLIFQKYMVQGLTAGSVKGSAALLRQVEPREVVVGDEAVRGHREVGRDQPLRPREAAVAAGDPPRHHAVAPDAARGRADVSPADGVERDRAGAAVGDGAVLHEGPVREALHRRLEDGGLAGQRLDRPGDPAHREHGAEGLARRGGARLPP